MMDPMMTQHVAAKLLLSSGTGISCAGSQIDCTRQQKETESILSSVVFQHKYTSLLTGFCQQVVILATQTDL